ncbi:MAG: small multi-drug export protein [Firmicutes bacterium]|nr:small multi-drug export protein [Bacillota bacterium]
MLNYLKIFFMSMVPIIELRGAVIYSQYLELPIVTSYLVCILGNMLPVPFIYFFARKILLWGRNKPVIGKVFEFIYQKGEMAGQKLTEKASRRGTFLALLLFVGIPLPGTGAWTGTLAASILDMGIKHTAAAVMLGVLMAGIIMMTAGVLGFSLI